MGLEFLRVLLTTLLSLSIGPPKTIKFPFVSNGKLTTLGQYSGRLMVLYFLFVPNGILMALGVPM